MRPDIGFHQIVAKAGDRQRRERRGRGQGLQAKPRNRRNPVAAKDRRPVKPGQAIDQVRSQETRRDPAAAFDQKPGYASPAQGKQGRAQRQVAILVELKR